MVHAVFEHVQQLIALIRAEQSQKIDVTKPLSNICKLLKKKTKNSNPYGPGKIVKKITFKKTVDKYSQACYT